MSIENGVSLYRAPVAEHSLGRFRGLLLKTDCRAAVNSDARVPVYRQSVLWDTFSDMWEDIVRSEPGRYIGVTGRDFMVTWSPIDTNKQGPKHGSLQEQFCPTYKHVSIVKPEFRMYGDRRIEVISHFNGMGEQAEETAKYLKRSLQAMPDVHLYLSYLDDKGKVRTYSDPIGSFTLSRVR